MHRIDHPTAVSVLPTPDPAGTPGYFTDGDPIGGIPATVVTRDWANAVQEEIANVIDAAGIPLDKTNNGQMAQAIAALIAAAAPDASESVKGIAKLATTALAQAWTDDETIITPKKLADAFQGGNRSVATNGYQRLPGGFIIQKGQMAIGSAASGTVTVTLPIAFPQGVYTAIAIDSSNDTNKNALAVPTGFMTSTQFQITWYRVQGTGTSGCQWIAFGW